MASSKSLRLASAACVSAVLLECGYAQEARTGTLRDVVVSASRREQRQFDAPAAIESVQVDPFQSGSALVNLSELTAGIPGLVIRDRQNMAQDLQLSIRGFGTRSTFGVRGVRILVDGIPASMPDGQGQVSSAVLTSASRVEVLRGPLAQLYGNAAGGVIQIFTKDPLADGKKASATLSMAAGHDGQRHVNASISAASDSLGGLLDVSQYRTDGYRDHSGAERTQVNAKLVARPASGTVITGIFNTLDQPYAKDPLGLSRAALEINPRQVPPTALAFDTRKSVSQQQAGLIVEQQLSETTALRARLHAGTRQVGQTLAFSGIASTSSGGVVDLDRDFGGLEFSLSGSETVGSLPVRWTLGFEKGSLSELRRGFVNNNGVAGDLRRNERNTAENTDRYAQLDLSLSSNWSAMLGVRSSQVRFGNEDRYVTPSNPDDSGSVVFAQVNPVAGIAWHAAEELNFYANVGRGFETPTLAEIAYRPGGTGANFALRPAKSTHTEIGMKIGIDSHKFQAALFNANGTDEIVPLTVENGRAIYQNVDGVRRSGAEVSFRSAWGKNAVQFAYTYLDARFKKAFSTGQGAAVQAMSRLPGVPVHSFFGQFEHFPIPALGLAVEARAESKVFVDDVNSEAAPGYAVFNARAGYAFRIGAHRAYAYARLDNFLNKRYAGSVIVNESSRRFYEAAPAMRILVGMRTEF